MSDYIKVCATCDHYPNDKHCIGCEWDRRTGDNTKWENRKFLDRKVIEDIKAEIEQIEINGQVDEHTMFIRGGAEVKNLVLGIIDKHTKGDTDADCD